MHKIIRKLSILCCVTLLQFSISQVANGQESLAALYSREGNVEFHADSSTTWLDAPSGTKFSFNDVVRTGMASRAGVLFSDGILLRMREATLVRIGARNISQQPIEIDKGSVHFLSREPKTFPEIKTPLVTAAVRGTEFVVEVQGDGTTIVSVLNGNVECSNQYGAVTLNRGEQSTTIKGQAPVKTIMVNPLDAVQWALYYPAVTHLSDYTDYLQSLQKNNPSLLAQIKDRDQVAQIQLPTGNSWEDSMTRGVVLYQRGDLPGARSEIVNYKGKKPAGMLLFSSALALAGGEVSDAKRDIALARQAATQMGGTLGNEMEAAASAQESIIALTTNKGGEARRNAEAGLAANPESLSALVARSYVAQSERDIDSAKSYIERARTVAPQNAFVLARLAEIELGGGHLDEALQLAMQAHSLQPDDDYVLSVLGFCELANLDGESAGKHFREATDKAGGSALAHLGLGLSQIREGDLESGKLELQKAVHLEPGVSLYRSYLGKAFFEAEQSKLAFEEYKQAMALDPLDPTPHLYRAYSSLAANDPIDALREVEESIRLNDNRAVFRSSLLLDQDLGVRSSSLSEVAQRLGFIDVAKREAVRAIGHDYSNGSAHLLLADLNRFLGNQDAGLAEELVARLLLPVSYNSILPSQASDSSYNEYTALFDRPMKRVRVGVDAISQYNELDETVSFIQNFNQFGYGLSYKDELGEGLLDEDLDHASKLQASVKGQLTPSDIVLFDSAARFYKSDLSDDDASTEINEAAFGLGANHRFGPGSHLVAQVRYGDTENERRDTRFNSSRDFALVFDDPTKPPVSTGKLGVRGDTDESFEGTRFDSQYIQDTEIVSFVFGGGILDGEVTRDEDGIVESSELQNPPPQPSPLPTPIQTRPPTQPPPSNKPPRKPSSKVANDPSSIVTEALSDLNVSSSGEGDESSQRLYLYSTWHIGELIDVELGASANRLELTSSSGEPPFVDGDQTIDELLPKTGIEFYPLKDTTIRAAYFETLSLAGFTDISRIEPSLVGGFNQLYDGFPGNKGEFVGVGIDQKFPGVAYLGAEYYERDFDDVRHTAFTVLELNPQTLALVNQGYSALERSAEVSEDVTHLYWHQILTDHLVSTFFYTRIQGDSTLDAGPFRGEEVSSMEFETSTEQNELSSSLRYFFKSGFSTFGRGSWQQVQNSGTNPGKSTTEGSDTSFIMDAGLGYQFPNRHGAIELEVRNILNENLPESQQSGFLTSNPTVTLRASYNF